MHFVGIHYILFHATITRFAFKRLLNPALILSTVHLETIKVSQLVANFPRFFLKTRRLLRCSERTSRIRTPCQINLIYITKDLLFTVNFKIIHPSEFNIPTFPMQSVSINFS